MEVRPVDARDAGEIERGVAALARTSNSGLSRHGGVREELATGVGRVLINAQIAACTEFADCEEFRFQFTKLSGTIVTKLFSPLSSIRRTI
jgi:hypothetical protein